ncbi:MAG: hypothetical protein EXX96DRAFT_537017 [Benjaminiella poitrasii]|nr:MAG: hypothetical protein EXX96DRAFT_537017 [Benjaminiella poitrasii]
MNTTDGLVERFMATLQILIVTFMDLQHHQTAWDEYLNEFMLAYNSNVHESTKFLPFNLVHDHRLRSLVSPDSGVQSVPHIEYAIQTKDFLSKNHHSQAKDAILFNEHRQEPSIRVGDKVLTNFPVHSNAAPGRAAKLVRSWCGYFRVTTILSPDCFNVVDIATSKVW